MSCYSPNFSCSNLFLRENESCIVFLKSSLHYEHTLCQLVLHTQAVSPDSEGFSAAPLDFVLFLLLEQLGQRCSVSNTQGALKGNIRLPSFSSLYPLNSCFSVKFSFALFSSVHSCVKFISLIRANFHSSVDHLSGL